MHLVLGHRGVGVRRLLERHQLGQGLAADDDAGRVGRGVAGHTLQLPGEVDDPVDRRVPVVHLLQLGAELERLVEADAELVRDRLRDPVDVAVGVPEHAAHVADRRPGQHRAEGDDLGDVVGAVLAADVVDDLVAAAVLEVDVDVRHGDPVRVEEPLEGQLVVDRVDRGDAQGVGDDRPRGAPPAGGLDPLLAGEADEVGHDEEVARVAHRGDRPELVVQARLELGRDGAVAAGQAALAFGPQPALDGLAVRHREVRDPQLAERQLEVHHLGDPARVPVGLDLVREEGEHLRRRLQVELGALELQPVRRVEVAAGPHAEEDVVGVGLRLVDVVEVVRHDEREAGLRRQAEELRVEAGLLGDPVVLELQEEVARAEDVAVLAGQGPGQLPVVDLERLRDLPAEAGGEADEALGVAGQELAVDPRLVVVAVEVGVGEEPAEVPVADEVLGQEDQVEGLRVGLPLAVAHGPAGDVRLHADDRLDPLGPGGLVEGDRAVEGAVVGQGEGIEARAARPRRRGRRSDRGRRGARTPSGRGDA